MVLKPILPNCPSLSATSNGESRAISSATRDSGERHNHGTVVGLLSDPATASPVTTSTSPASTGVVSSYQVYLSSQVEHGERPWTRCRPPQQPVARPGPQPSSPHTVLGTGYRSSSLWHHVADALDSWSGALTTQVNMVLTPSELGP